MEIIILSFSSLSEKYCCYQWGPASNWSRVMTFMIGFLSQISTTSDMFSKLRLENCKKWRQQLEPSKQATSVPSGPCDWLTADDYKFVLDVNLSGMIAVTLSVLPCVQVGRGGIQWKPEVKLWAETLLFLPLVAPSGEWYGRPFLPVKKIEKRKKKPHCKS